MSSKTRRHTWTGIGVLNTPLLTLCGFSRIPEGQVVCSGRTFREANAEAFLGFYDWLRTAPEKIVGVRFLPLAESDFILSLYDHLSFATRLAEGGIELLFDSTDYVASLSDDQAFSGNRIFLDGEGGALVTFGTTDLSEGERRSIHDADAKWITLSAR